MFHITRLNFITMVELIVHFFPNERYNQYDGIESFEVEELEAKFVEDNQNGFKKGFGPKIQKIQKQEANQLASVATPEIQHGGIID